MATSGGKHPLGTAAGGIDKPGETLGPKPLGPLAHHGALDPDQPSHLGVGVPGGQEQDHAAPAHQPGRHRGGTLPVFQGLTLLWG